MDYGNEGGFRRGGEGFKESPRRMHDAVCSICGGVTKLPFAPVVGRIVLCRACSVSLDQHLGNLTAATFELPGAVANGAELPNDTSAYERILVDVGEVNDELIRRLRVTPELMYALTPRKFEELVAELLARMGYIVQLTPPTKDGGFDIAAARKDDVGSFLYLVECKRYHPARKVGVELVRSLYGVVEQRGASGGVLVTTSFFTNGACEFQNELQGRMNLRDYTALQQWLRKTYAH